ncbi:MAG TPA: helix-turn-helix transcriptional regulator [Chloroflexota bacterium]|nr:helix-turn-helix transcriptional regulator [Chloroflexota bacterium]
MSGAWRKQPEARQRLSAFGEAVRRFRDVKGISQEELAFRAGLHRTYVSNLERGLINPTLLSMYTLAEALGTTVVAFLE